MATLNHVSKRDNISFDAVYTISLEGVDRREVCKSEGIAILLQVVLTSPLETSITIVSTTTMRQGRQATHIDYLHKLLCSIHGNGNTRMMYVKTGDMPACEVAAADETLDDSISEADKQCNETLKRMGIRPRNSKSSDGRIDNETDTQYAVYNEAQRMAATGEMDDELMRACEYSRNLVPDKVVDGISRPWRTFMNGVANSSDEQLEVLVDSFVTSAKPNIGELWS